MFSSKINWFCVTLLAAYFIAPSLGYNEDSANYYQDLVSGGGRSYRYVSPKSNDYYNGNSNNRIRERRYYGPLVQSSDYPSSSVPVAKTRRRFYTVEDTGPSKSSYVQ